MISLNSIRLLNKKVKNGLVAALFISAQIGFATAPFLPAVPAYAAPVCVNDTAGANDPSGDGQKDLTKLCVDYAGVPVTVTTTWNWDETTISGGNTLDACNLFDTDNDGFANTAVCVTAGGSPISIQAVTTYSCSDTKIDRCASPSSVIPTGTTSCSVSGVTNDPFVAGDNYPGDTQGSCTISLSAVGGSTAVLIDVCSFPSASPTSVPSDCVVARPSAGKLEVRKDLVPDDVSKHFNLQIDNVTRVTTNGDGTTGEVVVSAGNHTVGETAGASTTLTSYSSKVSCRDQNGTGTEIASVNPGTSVSVNIADGTDVVCIITNTASGSITIVKDAQPDSAQDFAFTATGSGVSSFSLDDDADPTLSNQRVFTGLGAGSYTFAETPVSGWDLTNASCSDGSPVNNVQLSAGENITCTFTNVKRGQLIVQKTTNPTGAPTQFTINASGSGTVTGGGAGTITDATDKSYEVTPGTYSVAETVPAGWSKTGDTCQNVVVAAGATVTCLITNTKLGSLTIIKDALPNDPQDFLFNVTNLAGGSFSLDDDADPTLSNQKVFSNLLPGQYTVTEQALAGWSLTSLTCDNTPVVGSTASITLIAGQNSTCTFTNTKHGSISGTKYTANVDLSLGPVLSGWTIFIDSNNNGVLDGGEQSDVTDASGGYSFIDLLPSTYVLKEVLLAGWTQIFGPTPVNLSAGQNSTGNDFGNFQNASIGGFKWNDKNANGVVDQNEEHLNGWTITLYNDGQDQDTDLDDIVSSTATAGDGDYSFTNLAPGTYAVCETAQTNWVQTFPVNNGCHTIVINLSGETNQANFGNQGRGNIVVVKNVDSDGNGTVDFQDVTNWTWDIDGSGNFATGSSNVQNVAAGNYTVSEDQQANYHVTASSCSGETVPSQPTTSLTATVGVGETVTCTFVNTRDTGTITVNKAVNPTNDTGAFNLQIDGTTRATNVSHGGTTGAVQVPTGTHSATELAGLNTSLSNYSSTFSCTNDLTGSGTTTGNFTVSTGQNITCTFTNVRLATLQISKDIVTTNASNVGQDFAFTTTGSGLSNFSLDDDADPTLPNIKNFINLTPGSYSVTESATAGWAMTSLICFGTANKTIVGSTASLTLAPGENAVCAYTNTELGSISGIKYTSNADSSLGPVLGGWTIFIDTNGNGILDGGEQSDVTDVNGAYDFIDLMPGSYTLWEVLTAGWTKIFGPGPVDLAAGQNSTGNNFGNFENASIDGYKWNDRDANGVVDQGEEHLNGWTVTLLNDGDDLDTDLDDVVTSAVTAGDGDYSFTGLTPGTYSVCETQQANWAQTFPANNGCHTIVINLSGEENEANFGNQGRGTIAVIKHVDTDGDGTVDEQDVTDWTWDIDGSGNFATGSGNAQNVAAGSYDVTEDQINGYTLTSVECSSGEEAPEIPRLLLNAIDDITSVENGTNVTIEPGDNIICTFVNTRDTGTLTLVKNLTPSTDDGKFNLHVNGDEFATDVGDNGSTGTITLPTDTYSASETAGINTNLNDYESSYVCRDGNTVLQEGNGTTINQIEVAKDQDVVCTFYNNKGQILGEEVPALVDTGSNILGASLVSLLLIGAVSGLAIATRRTATSRS